jgi:chromosome segregation ATPase
VVVGLGLFLYLRRRAEAAALAPSTALVTLQPEQVNTALAPLREEMQTRMLETLNQAAVGLEAWANKRKEEQEALMAIVQRQSNSLDAAQLALQKTRTQYMEESNRLLVEQRQITGNLAESNSRIEGTMREMQVQTNRTEAIAEELKRAVSDLDRARDEQAQTLAEIAALHERLQAEKTGTEKLRADLLLKEQELMRQQATLVSLQILLEEDKPLPPGALEGNFGRPAHPPTPPPDASPRPPVTGSATVTLPHVTTIAQPPCHFQFLPPDHPETPSPG